LVDAPKQSGPAATCWLWKYSSLRFRDRFQHQAVT
jgi:hypothetical protein